MLQGQGNVYSFCNIIAWLNSPKVIGKTILHAFFILQLRSWTGDENTIFECLNTRDHIRWPMTGVSFYKMVL